MSRRSYSPARRTGVSRSNPPSIASICWRSWPSTVKTATRPRYNQPLQRTGRASRSSSFGRWSSARPAAERRSVMPAEHEIRADYDRDTIVIYQAYAPAIADAALKAGRFVPPFSFHRMTWIKPSFLWLMHRSNWGQKGGQERVLAVRVRRAGWEKALALAVLTSFEPTLFASPDDWAERFATAKVHLQW